MSLLQLADLRCVDDPEDVIGWSRQHRKLPYEQRQEQSALDAFCADCLPSYRKEMEAENRCLRVKEDERKQRAAQRRAERAEVHNAWMARTPATSACEGTNV